MPIPVALLAALPWKKIATAAAGALVVAVLVAPWILWRVALKDTAVARAELVVVEISRDQWAADAAAAIANRERIEAALETMTSATLALAEKTAELGDLANAAGIRARELAAARAELEALSADAAELRRRAEFLTVCETRDLVLLSIAEGP
jgi:hypothetical protein